jgi:hypothetical protein
MIGSFDARAARISSELHQDRYNLLSAEQIVGLGGKRSLKVDCQIVAAAINSGADTIYSDDEGVEHFAQGRLSVVRLSDAIIQPTLFEVAPILESS